MYQHFALAISLFGIYPMKKINYYIGDLYTRLFTTVLFGVESTRTILYLDNGEISCEKAILGNVTQLCIIKTGLQHIQWPRVILRDWEVC